MGGIRPPTRPKGDMATCATAFFYKPCTDSWPSSRPHAAIQTEGGYGGWRRRRGGTKDPFVRSNAASIVLQLDTTLHQRERVRISEFLDRKAQLREHQIRARKGITTRLPFVCVRKLLGGKNGGRGRGAFLNGFLDRKGFFYSRGWKIDERIERSHWFECKQLFLQVIG